MQKNWHSRTPSEVLGELNSDLHSGLTGDEVSSRLQEYGPNELRKASGISAFTIFKSQFKDVLMIILLIAIVLSAAIGELMDAAIVFVIVIFCAVLGFVQEYRAERALEALKKMLSPTITVLRAGKEEEVPSSELVPGDILLVEAGDKVPADARVLECYSMRCDEASLTGESSPVTKDPRTLPEDTAVGDRRNTVFTGTTITYGRGKAIVTSTGMNTELGKIAAEVATVEVEETPLEKRTGEIGKWLGITATSICFLIAGVSLVRAGLAGEISTKLAVEMVMFGVALAVAAVPEALPAIVTGALAIGMHQMAQRNALIRRMPAVETLGCTTVVCSDKTGTLTRGEMTVRKIYACGKLVEVSGVGYTPEGVFHYPDAVASINHVPFWPMLQAGLLCNDASLEQVDGKWVAKGDPTESALVVAAAKAGLNLSNARLKNPRTGEIPFSSERKRMTTVHRSEDGKSIAYMKGAPEVVLDRCGSILAEDGPRPITAEDRTEILKTSEGMALSALRMLGLAYREVPDAKVCTDEAAETDFIFLGLTGMMDPPRPEATEAIRVCREVGIRPIMITGDHKLTAMAVASEMGIYRDGDLVLTGAELAVMSDEELERTVDRISVYARVSPLDKLKIVRAWKARGEVVAMTGDGVNDAPALKQADIGIAMGISGTEVTKEAADMVLSDDNFATIISAIERGRWIYDNIKKYLTYLLSCNIVEVCVIGGVVMVLGPAYLPLLPAAILYINLATDGLPALALGVSPPDPDIMRRPPRNPHENVFSRDVLAFIALALLVQVPLFFFLYFHALSDVLQARTEMFFLFIVVELVVALSFRSMKYSIFKAPPHRWLILAIVWELVLITVLLQVPAVREAFGITAPSLETILIILGLGAIAFTGIEVLKLLLRRRSTFVERGTSPGTAGGKSQTEIATSK